MSAVQYSGSYEDNLFGTSSACAAPVDNNKYVGFSVADNTMSYASQHYNYRMTNRSTCK